MTGREHVAEAERLLLVVADAHLPEQRSQVPVLLARAQVHATLALTVVTDPTASTGSGL